MTEILPENGHLPPRGMSRGRQLVILAIAAGVILGLFLLVPLAGRLLAPKPPPPSAAPPPGTFEATAEQWATLGFATAEPMAFSPTAETDGKIAADDNRTTPVFSPFTGRVTRVMARVGDRVAKGAPLFAIDASEFIQGQSDLLNAVAQVRLTSAAAARQEALFKDKGAALKDVEQSQSDLANAQVALAAARGRLRALGETDAAIAAIERGGPAKGVTAETIVTAPIGGIVTQKSVSPGENLASLASNGASPAAYSISDLSVVWLVGNLREADAPKARVGQRVQVRVAAFPGQVFSSRLSYVAAGVDPATRRVTVRAEIPNPGGVLLPEMFATFSLVTGDATTSVAVPEQAVVYEGDTARVWVAGTRRTLELRRIRTGQTMGDMVQVLSGLSAGERVVTAGALFIDRASTGE